MILQYFLLFSAAGILLLYLFGIRFYAVTTGSMSPAIPEGSLCVVNRNTPFSELHTGDVITFRSGNSLRVTHRVIRIEGDGIITKGDAGNAEDAKVTADRYLGKTIWSIPKAGAVALYLKSRKGILTVAVCILLLMIPTIFNYIKEKQHRSQ